MDATFLLADLDGEQRHAVATESRLVAVIAGAGSGKTRVLTRRLAYRVATGTADESHTLALTFTRQAAGELRRRLPRLGVGGSVTAGTFHSVAHGLLQQRWRDLDRQPPTLTADRRRILARLVPSGTDLEALAIEVDWAAARGLSPSAYESAVRAGSRSATVSPGAVAELLDRYRQEQRRAHVIDLDDLLSHTIAALRSDPAFADRLRWKFRHLLVDEAQDLNPLQHQLIDLINADRNDLYLVGDPAQAVYGFNGADPALLIDASVRFPGIEVVRLAVNHRSTPQVVEAGSWVLPSELRPVPLRSGRDHGVAVDVIAADDELAEAAAVAKVLGALDPSLVRASQVAVLARTNAQLPAIGRALATAGVAVRQSVHGDGSAMRATVGHVYRLPDSHALRAWAQDALEGVDPNPSADDSDGSTDASVARAVLEFLRTNPTGDGAGLRAWVDATDPFGATVGGVELLTFHAAKGREWHSVVLVGCETSLVPHRSATTAAARSEEARLLYVAITRATDHLVVMWARRRGGYQRRLTPLLDGFASTVPPLTARPATVKVGTRRGDDLAVDRLRAWRSAVARAGSVLPETICTDAALAIVARTHPDSPEALDAATGIGLLTARRLYPGIAEALEPDPVG